jgi:DNA-binding NtrC family response regulator
MIRVLVVDDQMVVRNILEEASNDAIIASVVFRSIYQVYQNTT